ncbi:NAD(P)/FAD-dependent oxidoreductase [Catalinimonas niigatensis]|uniref:NAD(P)/FAD-dependent oxidoreductase n=1 Tax=Catalinimonas niigatensis TaxID=1397264 RepID=UPI002664F79E|nr:NAD(P)/FAD-dependent oxidoreductase [Catalinimonas niigatensis]WPP52034.1 NAD(P)/FAD-dependent oxidoreductase [Catalinimonas niigatensis]
MMEPNIPDSPYPRVVILGGGFAGLSLAKTLRNDPFQIVLIDKSNYHTFQPLLYQIAIGGLEPDSVVIPYWKIFENHPNLVFRMAEVLSVNTTSKEVYTDIGIIPYDYLVVATGAKTNFFRLQATVENAMPLKSVPQALDLRSLIFQNFEKAVRTINHDEFESLIDIVIVGGGPTGVEMAGALAELRQHVLPNNFKELDFRRMDIYLIESGSRLLRGMSEYASEKALQSLQSMNVKVLLNTSVRDYNGRLVQLSHGKQILSSTLIWAAGVQGNIPAGIDKRLIVRGNRLSVDEYLQVPDTPDVFAMGDIAAIVSGEQHQPHAMIAPVAIQQGKLVAHNLIRLKKQKPLRPFIYKDRGVMATVGRHHAVVDLPFFRFSGVTAWMVWLMVHLMALVGYRNKLVVFLNWAFSYISYDYSLHLIIKPYERTTQPVAAVA